MRRLAFFSAKVEQPGVVFFVGLAEQCQQVRVHLFAVGGVAQCVLGLDAALLADAQEDDAVDGQLHGAVQLAGGQRGIAQGEVARQFLAPAFHFHQKSVVHVGRAALAFESHCKLVERALMHRLVREQAVEFVPFADIFRIREQLHPADMRRVAVDGFGAAVIHRQLLEITQNADGNFGRPGVTPDLESRIGIGLDVDRRFFGFQEEKRVAAGLKSVIGGFGLALHLHRALVDHFAKFFGVILAVGQVPTQRLEERVEEVAAQLGLVIVTGAVGGALPVKAVNQRDDFGRCGDDGRG